jgi:hypothetical protein
MDRSWSGRAGSQMSAPRPKKKDKDARHRGEYPCPDRGNEPSYLSITTVPTPIKTTYHKGLCEQWFATALSIKAERP